MRISTVFDPHLTPRLPLQAQARARATALQRVAGLRLAALAASESRPRLLMRLDLHAPKVAIPDDTGQATLLMDLGRLLVASTPSQPPASAAGIPPLAATAAAFSTPVVTMLGPPPRPSDPEEAGLYQQLQLKIDSVAAYIYAGRFAWPSNRGGDKPAMQGSAGSALHQGPNGSSSSSFPDAHSAGALSVGRSSSVTDLQREGRSASADPGAWDLLIAMGLANQDGSVLQSPKDGTGSSVSYQKTANQPVLVPLLDRFGLEAYLQVATAAHPKLPQLRAFFQASPLRLSLSPWRLHRLLRVFACATRQRRAALDRQHGVSSPGLKILGGETSPAALPLWFTDTEFRAPVQVLAWDGVGRSMAKWHARYASVWRGRVLLAAGPDDSAVLESR